MMLKLLLVAVLRVRWWERGKILRLVLGGASRRRSCAVAVGERGLGRDRPGCCFSVVEGKARVFKDGKGDLAHENVFGEDGVLASPSRRVDKRSRGTTRD